MSRCKTVTVIQTILAAIPDLMLVWNLFTHRLTTSLPPKVVYQAHTVLLSPCETADRHFRTHSMRGDRDATSCARDILRDDSVVTLTKYMQVVEDVASS
jgi:hypothetical protein